MTFRIVQPYGKDKARESTIISEHACADDAFAEIDHLSAQMVRTGMPSDAIELIVIEASGRAVMRRYLKRGSSPGWRVSPENVGGAPREQADAQQRRRRASALSFCSALARRALPRGRFPAGSGGCPAGPRITDVRATCERSPLLQSRATARPRRNPNAAATNRAGPGLFFTTASTSSTTPFKSCVRT